MQQIEDLNYLRERSTQEFQMALKAASPLVARPHYTMAVAYHERAVDLKRKLIRSV
jgi:NAD/NADP transhydrogenase beta subunit